MSNSVPIYIPVDLQKVLQDVQQQLPGMTLAWPVQRTSAPWSCVITLPAGMSIAHVAQNLRQNKIPVTAHAAGGVIYGTWNKRRLAVVEVPSDRLSFALHTLSHYPFHTLFQDVVGGAGMVLRNDGLYCNATSGMPHVSPHTFHVTSDFNDMLRFLGYDADAFAAGFATTEAVYEYIASGRYWLAELHNGTLDNPFAVWVRQQAHKGIDARLRRSHYQWFLLASDYFPGFAEAHAKEVASAKTQSTVHAKFNRARTARITGLSGRALNVFLDSLQEQHTSRPEWQEFVLNHAVEQVDAWVRERFQHYQEKNQ